MVPGDILQVSPSTYEGHPLNGAADELALDFAGFGEGAVAWRQQPAPGSGFSRPRVFVSEIPSSFDPHGAAFAGARIVDGGGAEGLAGPIGPLSMAVDGEGEFDVGFGSGDASFDARGTETSVSAPVRLDEGSSEVPGEPVLTRADDGALAAAWKVEEHGAGAVAVLERRADGTPNRQLVSAPGGGAVHQLDLGGSQHGDALIGFLQGDGANTKIAAVVVRAPPGEFVIDTPVQLGQLDAHPAAVGNPTRGRRQAHLQRARRRPRSRRKHHRPPKPSSRPSEVSNGVHTIQVEATDSLGQVVDSEPATLKVDRKPPQRARARARRRRDRARQRRPEGRKLGRERRLGEGALRRRALRARPRDSSRIATPPAAPTRSRSPPPTTPATRSASTGGCTVS